MLRQLLLLTAVTGSVSAMEARRAVFDVEQENELGISIRANIVYSFTKDHLEPREQEFIHNMKRSLSELWTLETQNEPPFSLEREKLLRQHLDSELAGCVRVFSRVILKNSMTYFTLFETHPLYKKEIVPFNFIFKDRVTKPLQDYIDTLILPTHDTQNDSDITITKADEHV